jgi:hypothetical protein
MGKRVKPQHANDSADDVVFYLIYNRREDFEGSGLGYLGGVHDSLEVYHTLKKDLNKDDISLLERMHHAESTKSQELDPDEKKRIQQYLLQIEFNESEWTKFTKTEEWTDWAQHRIFRFTKFY